MENYRQMLIDEQAHRYITEAKTLLVPEGKRLSSKEVINELIGRRVRYLKLKKEVRDYINEFVSNAVTDQKICGLLLFGSAAKNNFDAYSDIDIMILVNQNDTLNYMNRINKMIRTSEPARKKLVAKGMHLHISPLVLSIADLKHFRPIYINFLEEGIILFERKEMLTNFLNDIRKKIEYEHARVNDTMVIRWKL